MNQPFRKKPKRRRFRPLRRLLLISILGLLIYGLISSGLWVYTVVFTPRIRLATVELAPQVASYSANAVVVRDEVVVVASRAGTLRHVADHMVEVRASQPILEMLDMPLLTAIDKQLAEEEKKYLDVVAQSDDYLEHKASQLTSALAEIRSLAARYATLLRNQDSSQASTVFKDLERVARSVDKLQSEYEQANRSVGQFESVQAVLLEQRQSAIFTVTAPVNGLVSYRIDALGSQLRPSIMNSIELDFFRQISDETTTMENGLIIAAGQPVCAIINPSEVYLLFEVREGPRLDLESSFEVTVQGELINATFIQRIATEEEGTYIYLYAVGDAPQVLLERRVVPTDIRSLGFVTVSIPKQAIVTVDGVDMVYGPNDFDVIAEYPVVVLEVKGNRAIVFGLTPGQDIVSTPRLVTPGDPFENAGGGKF